MKLLIYLLTNTLAIAIGSYLLPGVKVDSLSTAIVVAVIIGIVNTFLKPILTLLTLPLTILTFGLFSFVINGLIILLISRIVPGFTVNGLLWAILFSIVISIVNSFLNSVTK